MAPWGTPPPPARRSQRSQGDIYDFPGSPRDSDIPRPSIERPHPAVRPSVRTPRPSPGKSALGKTTPSPIMKQGVLPSQTPRKPLVQPRKSSATPTKPGTGIVRMKEIMGETSSEGEDALLQEPFWEKELGGGFSGSRKGPGGGDGGGTVGGFSRGN